MADPMFTAEQFKEDGRNRVVSTVGQSGTAAAVVLIVVSALHARHLLHGHLSNDLFAAYALVLTGAASALKNLSRLRGHG